MFFKKDIYVLEITNLNNLRLYGYKDKNVISRFVVDENIVKDNEILDDIQYSYIINKFLRDIDNSSRIVLRLNSTENIFRYENVESLSKEEADNYIKYNLDSMLPVNSDGLIIKSNYSESQIFAYGIKENIVDFYLNLFNELGFKNVYVTTFISEVIAIKDQIDKNFIFLNIQQNYVEIVLVEDRKVSLYKSKELINKLDESRNILDYKEEWEIKNVLESIDFKITNSKIDKIYIFGNKSIFYHWKNIILNEYDFEIEELNFKEEDYFGV